MGKKVDIAEVSDLSDDLSSAVSDIQSQLDSIMSNIDQISSMDSFSGQAATQAKGYFNDLHKTVLESFSNLFTDLESQLKQHLDSFQSQVDNSASAIVQSDYLNENKMDIDDEYENLNSERQSINRTLNDVADISSVAAPVFSSVTNDKNEAVETIFDLEEDLVSFTSEGSQHDSQTKDLLHHIEVTINRANTQSGTARFTDYQSSSTSVGLLALKDYNADKREAEINRAREVKNNIINDLGETAQTILNNAYTQLENGEIDNDQYNMIVSVLNRTKENLSEEELNEEVPQSFVKYLNDNRGLIARDLGVPIGASMLEYKGTVKLGTLIQKFRATPGPAGPNSFRMVNSKSATISKPFFKHDGFARKSGRAIGRGFIAFGFGYGMGVDLRNGKTVGEATTHNTVATGLGWGTTAAAVKGLKVGTAFLIGANPASWAAVGIAAAGTAIGVGVTMGFNYMYDNNILGIQDGLDWAGQQIDKGWNNLKGWASDAADSVGNAVTGALDFINPFS